MLRLSIIAAMSTNQVIGSDNKLPWHLPADLKHFKALTTGKPILMGRKTYESIGRPLPNRLNLILTRDKHWQATGCEVVYSLDEAKALAEKHQAAELMIIGGEQLYREYLSVAQRLYLTIVMHDFLGDAHFPALNWAEWHIVDESVQPADTDNPYACRFLVMERI